MKMLLRPMSVGVLVLLTLVNCLQAQTAPAPATATTPAPAAPGVAEPAAPAVSVVLTPAIASQYMFRGVRLGGLSFEPTIEVDSGNFAVGVWGDFPIKDRVPGQSDPEVDPYGSYTFTVNDSVSVAPGFTWYNYPNADTSTGFYKSRFEPNIAFNYTVCGIRFTPKFYYDVVLKGPTYEFNIAAAIPLKALGTELDWNATAGMFIIRDAAKGANPAVKNWGNYYFIGVSAPFAINYAAKLILGVAYTKGSGNFLKAGSTPRVENPAAIGRGVVTISYFYAF
jgi:uncharacterized protein (TIGR02001 family)